MAFLFDSEAVEETKRARNTGPQPGGSSASGRVSYRDTMQGRMLRGDQEALRDDTNSRRQDSPHELSRSLPHL